MITHLLTRIDLMMNSLSKGQKRIALFIEEHYDKAAFMTASKLGETVGVSESTVVRFATELGYDGYPKLQKAMQEMIRNKLTSVQRIEVTSNRIGNDNVLDSVLNQDIDKIRRTIEETSHEDFARAVDEICKAERIYIFGVRSTAAIANFLAYYFEMIFDNVRVITSGSQTETFEQIFRITDKDVMIGISFPVTVQCRLRQWTLPVQVALTQLQSRTVWFLLLFRVPIPCLLQEAIWRQL